MLPALCHHTGSDIVSRSTRTLSNIENSLHIFSQSDSVGFSIGLATRDIAKTMSGLSVLKWRICHKIH